MTLPAFVHGWIIGTILCVFSVAIPPQQLNLWLRWTKGHLWNSSCPPITRLNVLRLGQLQQRLSLFDLDTGTSGFNTDIWPAVSLIEPLGWIFFFVHEICWLDALTPVAVPEIFLIFFLSTSDLSHIRLVRTPRSSEFGLTDNVEHRMILIITDERILGDNKAEAEVSPSLHWIMETYFNIGWKRFLVPRQLASESREAVRVNKKKFYLLLSEIVKCIWRIFMTWNTLVIGFIYFFWYRFFSFCKVHWFWIDQYLVLRILCSLSYHFWNALESNWPPF